MSDQPGKHSFGRNVAPPRGDEVHVDNEHSFEDGLPGTVRDAETPVRKRSRFARSGFVRLASFMLTLVFLGVLGFGAVIWYGKTEFEKPGPLSQAATVVVKPGTGLNIVTAQLEEKGIIPEQGAMQIFKRGVQASGKDKSIKAGEFGFKPGMSMQQVMLELTEGKPITYSITLPEGLTSYQIIQRVAADPVLTGELPDVPEEGSLLPDTYVFQRGASREGVVQRMKDAQKKALEEVWASRVDGLPLKSPQEMAILASIVEKETGVGSERPHVASVFINRLRNGQRLQTDPTIIYGIWGGKGKPKDRGGLRKSELEKQTPYNTYQIDGLPPTPIANAGIASLKAVANPLETDDLFFVADGTGGHVFAKTLEEHNRNVAKWREIEAERRKAAQQSEQSN